MTVRETNRWRGVTAVALLVAAAGMVTRTPGLLLAAALGLVFAVYARQAGPPAVELACERVFDVSEPGPGDAVEVTLTVRNVGDSTLPDVMLVDGVPDGLSVTRGSPRRATALRPGKRATFSYVVTARRGVHTFGPVTVLARDASGTFERESRVGPETTLTCVPPVRATDDLPLHALTTRYTGRVTTDVGGAGLEFYATKAYRPGDPLARVDWNRYARSGELATLQFREERAANVVLLVDAREVAYRVGPDGVHAVDRGVEAARAVCATLLDAGDRIGLASLGPGWYWLGPGAGRDHRARIRHQLATHPAFDPTPPERPYYPTVQLRQLRKRLPGDAQIVAFAPLCDDAIVALLRRLDAYGYPVTIVSPDVTAADTPGQQLAHVRRVARIARLRRAGARVVDWNPTEPLGAALTLAARRWCR